MQVTHYTICIVLIDNSKIITSKIKLKAWKSYKIVSSRPSRFCKLTFKETFCEATGINLPLVSFPYFFSLRESVILHSLPLHCRLKFAFCSISKTVCK